MISRRDKLLNRHWEEQYYQQHRLKVQHAKHAIDVTPPACYPHVALKPKKVQIEKERLMRVEDENMRLLEKLGIIMRSKRIENLWLQPRPNFLHREKLFEVVALRPKTALLKTWPNNQTLLPSRTHSNQSLPLRNSAGARRCPTCSAKPEQTEVKIPEERVPWQPRPKTWNYKIRKMQIAKIPEQKN